MDSTFDSEVDPLLKPRVVADMLGIEYASLAMQRFRGEGPAYVKMSEGQTGRVRYRRSDVIAYINSRERIEPVKQVA